MAHVLAKLASAAEFLALPGVILLAYLTTNRISSEPRRVRRFNMPSALTSIIPSVNPSNNERGRYPESSPANPSSIDTWTPEPDRWYREPDHVIKYDDGKSRGPPWKPRDRWYGDS